MSKNICNNENLEGFIEKINKEFLNLDASHLQLLKVMFSFIDRIETLRRLDLQKHGFSEGRMMVLVSLWSRQGPMNSSEIAQKIGVTRATMTGLIDGLEKDDYLIKTHSKEDRRIQLLELTPKGHDFINSIIPEHFGCWKKFTQELPPKDAREMTELFEKLLGAMNQSFHIHS